jgi:HEAT repeat protein
MIFFLPVVPYVMPAAAAEDNVEIGRRALQYLIGLMQHPDPEVRAEAAEAWGQVGNRAAIPLLRKALKDPVPFVQIEAAYALHKLGSKDALEPLEALALSTTTLIHTKTPKKDAIADEARAIARDNIRAKAIARLSDIGGVRTVELFEKTLNDPSPIVRDATAVGLAKLGFEELDDVFIEMLRDPNEARRAASAHALAQIGRPVGVEDLISAASDESAAVRAEAVMALGPTTDAKAQDAIIQALKDPSRLVQGAAAKALAQQGPSATKTLYEVAADTASPVLALKAMHSLARRGDRVNFDFLGRVLGYDDQDLLKDVVEVLDVAKGDKPVGLLKQIFDQNIPERVKLRVAAALLKRTQRVRI